MDPAKALPPHGTLASANFIGAIRVDAFLPRATYEQSLAGLAREITANPPRPGSEGVRLPGEGSAARHARSLAEGIRVSPVLWQEIADLAREVDVDHPLLGTLSAT